MVSKDGNVVGLTLILVRGQVFKLGYVNKSLSKVYHVFSQ